MDWDVAQRWASHRACGAKRASIRNNKICSDKVEGQYLETTATKCLGKHASLV